jgi:hypothetical protein
VRAAELVRGEPLGTGHFDDNHAWIDWRGPPGTFATVSMADVLAGRVAPSRFAGKVVLVGVTAPAEKDVFATAASNLPLAGVEVHANALETILAGFPLRPAGTVADLLLILALGAVPVALGLRWSALAVCAGSLAALLVFLGAAQLAFDAGRIVAVASPILALVLSAVAVIAAHAAIERRQREALEATLAALGVVPRQDAGFFICYRRDQSGFVANSLKAALGRRVGAGRVYLDEQSNRAGERWPARIEQAIYSCGAMFVLISPHWAQTMADGHRRLDDPQDWVRREVEAGLELPHRQARLVPLLHDGASMPDPSELPDAIKPLADWQAFVLTGVDLVEEIDSLLEAISVSRTLADEPPDGSPVDGGTSPTEAIHAP